MANSNWLRLGLAVAVAAAALPIAPTAARAQEAIATAAPPSAAEEVKALRAEITRLSRQLERLEASTAVTSGASQPPTSEPEEDVSQVRPAAEPVPAPLPTERVVVTQSSLDRVLQDAGSRYEFSAASGGGEVSIKLATDVSSSSTGFGWAHSHNWTFTATAPISKGGTTDLFALSGFTSDFDFRVAYNHYQRFLADGRNDPAVLRLRAKAVENCRGKRQAAYDKKQKDANLAARAEADPAKKEAMLAALAKAGAAEKEATLAACDKGPRNSAFIRAHFSDDEAKAKQAQREYLLAYFPDKPAYAYGLEGHVGYKEHSFIDTTALIPVEDDVDRVPWGVKAYWAFIPDQLTSFTASLEYQYAYKDKSSGVICPPGTGAAVTCLSGPLGAPGRKDSLIPALEWRHLVLRSKDNLIPRIGISAQLQYDLESDEYGVDVPIYLVPDDKSNLIGGIRFGFTSEKSELQAGVFVGASFSPR